MKLIESAGHLSFEISSIQIRNLSKNDDFPLGILGDLGGNLNLAKKVNIYIYSELLAQKATVQAFVFRLSSLSEVFQDIVKKPIGGSLCEDDVVLFPKSCLPALKTLTIDQKLLIRSTILSDALEQHLLSFLESLTPTVL